MRSKDNPHVRTVEGRAGEWCFEENGVGETNERNLAAPLGLSWGIVGCSTGVYFSMSQVNLVHKVCDGGELFI